MRRIIILSASLLLGIGICLGIAFIANVTSILPSFPAPAGEDDFAFRAAAFLFGVCPAFAGLGMWIGLRSNLQAGPLIRMWAGAIAGSFAVMILTRLLGPALQRVLADGAETYAVVAVFAAWILAASIGAYAVRVRKLPQRPEREPSL